MNTGRLIFTQVRDLIHREQFNRSMALYPMPRASKGMSARDQVALEVMQKHNIPVNDLYEVSKHFGPKMYVKPGDVHHTGKANNRLAEAVVEAVREQLK